MRKLYDSETTVTIEFDRNEIVIVRNLMLEVAFSLGEEISPRVGISLEEARLLFDALDLAIK